MRLQLFLVRARDGPDVCADDVPESLRQLQSVHPCANDVSDIIEASENSRLAPVNSRTQEFGALTDLRVTRRIYHGVEGEQREPALYRIAIWALVRRLAECFGKGREVRFMQNRVEFSRKPPERPWGRRDPHPLALVDVPQGERAEGKLQCS